MAPRPSSAQPAWLPLLYWLAGALAGLVFYVKQWQFLMPWGWVRANPHPGHLIVELTSFTWVALGGGMLGGWVARSARGLRLGASVAFAGLILLWALVGFVGWLTPNEYHTGCLSVVAAAFVLMLRQRPQREEGLFRFLRMPRGWNLFFFVLFVLLGTTADAVLLPNAPPSRLAAADFVLGRFITHVHQAALLWFLLAWHDRWVPPAVRWLGWTALALTPLFMMADILLKLMWSKGLLTLFAELEVGGEFDMRRAMEGGGVAITPGIVALFASAVLLVLAVFALCARGSRYMGWRINPVGIVLVAFFSWGVLQAEQGLGLVMKSRAWRWWEVKAAPLRFTSFAPDPGLASFQVSFRDPQAKPVSEEKSTAPHPDIYFFIVETLRADALTPTAAPFLCQWRDTECQPLGETFAGSNATHLSWFGLLSGRLPFFWEEARRAGQLSPVLGALRDAGYRLELRAACDMNYMDMLRTNFGATPQLDFMEFVDRNHPDFTLLAPEREQRMMAKLHDAVRQKRSSVSGTLRIIALDSTHYPYRWPASYTPPLLDYDHDPLFPLHPSAAQVALIRNRYENSVSWIDHQLAAFVSDLKSLGRYDDALIIVTGDHGEEFQEHGAWFHCSALSPEQTRVPLLIKRPKAMGRGPAFQQASHLDLAPTLLELAGCNPEVYADLPGHSLLHAGEHSIALATHFAARDGEGFMLRRGSVSAAFGWPQLWVAGVPPTLWLERTAGMPTPSGAAGLKASDYEALVKQNFPDVLERVFATFQAR